jgi:hypothetical protein
MAPPPRADGIPHNRGVTVTSTLPSLDGRRFAMVSSTTSVVDPDAPSVFQYWERDGAIWGDYVGDTVTFGRFVGTRTGDTIWVSFVHVLVADGTVVTGDGESEIELTDDGSMRLVEHYEMHGLPQLSVCEEIPAV